MKFMTAWVELKADMKPLAKDLATVKAMVRKTATMGASAFSSITKHIRRAAIGAVALGTALSVAIWKVTGLASAAEETKSKFGVVFSYLKREASAWSEKHAAQVGRSRVQLKQWMATLQDTFVPLGLARKEAFKLSKQIVELGIDLASFNDKADDDVIRDLTSAIIGNHETVRKFGVIIDENRLKMEALTQGITKNYNELTALEKVQLRIGIIMASTSDAQSDATRTAMSFTNQLKRLKGNLSNLGVTLGDTFMPILNKYLTGMNTFLEKNESKIGAWVKGVVNHFMWLKERMSLALGSMTWGERFKTVLKGLKEYMLAWMKSIISIAVNTVKGIGSSIGNFGKRRERAAEIYKERTGNTLEKVGMGIHKTSDLTPEEHQIWDQSKAQAAKEQQGSAIMDAAKNAAEDIKRYHEEARENTRKYAEGVARANNPRYWQEVGAINKKYAEKQMEIAEESYYSEEQKQEMMQKEKAVRDATQRAQQDILAKLEQQKKQTKILTAWKDWTKNLKQQMRSAQENLKIALRDVGIALKAGLLSEVEAFKARKYFSELYENDKKSTEGGGTGGSLREAMLSLQGLSMGGSVNPIVEEQRKTNRHLEDLKNREGLNI